MCGARRDAVAELAGQRRGGEVTGTLLERLGVDPFDQLVGALEARDRHVGEPLLVADDLVPDDLVPDDRRHRRLWCHRGARRGRVRRGRRTRAGGRRGRRVRRTGGVGGAGGAGAVAARPRCRGARDRCGVDAAVNGIGGRRRIVGVVQHVGCQFDHASVAAQPAAVIERSRVRRGAGGGSSPARKRASAINCSTTSVASSLRAGVLDAGAPQLVADEAEHQQADHDQDLAEAADRPADVAPGSRARSSGRPGVAGVGR